MRKLVTYAVVITTIVWSLGLAAVVPASAAYAPAAGDLIKTANDSAVYYIDADNKRVLFVNAVTFWSWYGGDWSSVTMGNDTMSIQTISQEDFDDLDVGGHVIVRPGSELIKFANSPRVYAVTPGGELRAVVASSGDDTVAKALYGDDYSVVTIQNGFESDYTKGDALTVDSSLPDGSLVKYEGSEDIYYIQDGDKRVIADDAFMANGFADSSVVTVPTSMTYSDGESVTEAEGDLTTVSGGTTPVVASGSMSVSMSSMTPASTTYLANSARSVFLVVDATNNSSADVVIDTFKVERAGLAVNADFSSIAVYEDSALGSQVGLNKTLNSDNRATFGTDITVPAGTTKKLYIVGNMAAAASTGNAPKLGLISMGLKGGSTLSGLDSAIWGNTMNLSAAVTIATVTIANGGSNPTTDSSPKVGDKNVDLAEIKITNDSSTEEVQVEKVTFKQAGSASDSDVEMYELINSSTGSVVATAPQVDKYVDFVLDTPLNIGKAKNISLMARAVEIVDGSSRTLNLDIQRDTDVVAKALTYDAYIRIDAASKWPNSSQPYFNASSDQTIGNGTLRIEASTSFNAANIAEGQTGVQLGEWLFTVKGESVDITQISTAITTSTSAATTLASDITNGIFYLVDTDDALTGATDAAATSGVPGVTSTDAITLDIGVHKIGFKADLSSDFSNNDTLQCGITAGSNLTVTGNTTGNTITATPSNEVQSSVQTIKTAKLNISTSINPPAQNIIRGDQVVAANIILDASESGDDLKMSQLKTDLWTTTMSPDEITSITLWDGDTQLLTTNDPEPTSSTASADVSTTWTLTDNLTIGKGTVKTLTIKVVTAGSTSANDILAIGAGVGGLATVKDSENEDVTPTYTESTGQEMTIQTVGTLTITRTDEMKSGMLNGNTDGIVIGEFSATAQNGGVDIEKIYVDIAAANSGGTDELEALYLYDGATQIATATLTSSNQGAVLFNMDSDPLTVAVNTTKTLTLKADTAIIANDGTATNGSANTGFTPSIRSAVVTAKTNGTTANITTATLTFPTYRVLKAVPIVTIASSGDSVSANGTYDLIDVTVTAPSTGPIGLYKMTFKVTTTTVTASSLTVYEGGTLVASVDSDATEGINLSYVDADYMLAEVYFNANTYGGEMRQVAAGTSKTYTLKADVTGYTANVSNGVSTSMTGDDGDHATNHYKLASTIDVAAADDDDDFIWSDLSYGNTSTTATVTDQWMNGFELDTAGGLVGTTSSAKSI